MMNILYVWFPASWGPSVVEAIQKRNVTCLAKKPIVRDPHIFDRREAAKGFRAREVTCRIQKWNIQADGFHPILVANARVDWLAMKDDDITKKFPILLEGILQDVFSQRASSAWQGAQPQKLTVSMLLPGTSSASEWRDLLQSRRQFWPTFYWTLSSPNLRQYKRPGREKKRLCGAVTISGGCARSSLMPPHGCKSRISSPPMTASTMYGFNGTAIPPFVL